VLAASIDAYNEEDRSGNHTHQHAHCKDESHDVGTRKRQILENAANIEATVVKYQVSRSE